MSPTIVHQTAEQKKLLAKAMKGSAVNAGLILTKFDQKGFLNRRSAYKITDWLMDGTDTDDTGDWPVVRAYTVPETPSFNEAGFSQTECRTYRIGRSIVYFMTAYGDDGYHGVHVLAYDTVTHELFFVQWHPDMVLHEILRMGEGA